MNTTHQGPSKNILDGPRVSVGIPTYNRPEGLRRTLECITGQKYKNLEIIVSDNCSPSHETETLVREFMKTDTRIHYYRQKTNQGAAYNFKFVLEKATGEFFMWAADDDEWEGLFISRLLNCLIQNPDIHVVMSAVNIVGDDGSIVDTIHYSERFKPGYNQLQAAIFAASHDVITFFVYGLYRISTARIFYKKLDNTFGKDMIIICELLLSSKFGYIEDILHVRHIHLKGTAERYAQEEIGKNYSDPFNYLILFTHLGPYLLLSPHIPLRHKFWVPIMVLRQGIWIGRIYANRLLNLLLVILRKNTIFHTIIVWVKTQLKV